MYRILTYTVFTFLLTFLLAPILSQAEPRVLTFDLGFDEVLGLTSIQDRNDVGDMLIGSIVANDTTLLVSRNSEDPVIRISCPGSTFTAAKKLTRNRRAVGFCTSPSGVTRGFLFYPDRRPMTVIHKPGASQTQAYGVNEGLVVVGDFRDAAGRFHGFRWVNGGVFTTFDNPFPGFPHTSLFAINNLWHIVGLAFNDAGEGQGFLLHDGVYTPLDVPGHPVSVPLDLNEQDEVVGVFLRPDGEVGSYRFDGTDYLNVAVPGPEVLITDVAALTNTGVIAGRFLVNSGIPDDFLSRGFVLSGLPLERIEPAPVLAMSRLAVQDAAMRPWCGPHGPAKLQGTSVCPQ